VSDRASDDVDREIDEIIKRLMLTESVAATSAPSPAPSPSTATKLTAHLDLFDYNDYDLSD